MNCILMHSERHFKYNEILTLCEYTKVTTNNNN